MTLATYRGGEGDTVTLQGNFSSELEDVHAGTMFDVTLTPVEEPAAENGEEAPAEPEAKA